MRYPEGLQSAEPRTWQMLNEIARKAYKNSNYEEALAAWREAVSPAYHAVNADKQSMLSNVILCRLHIGGKEQAQAAVSDAKMCIKLNPKYAKGYVRLASAYKALGNHSLEACDALEKALALNPRDPVASQMLMKEVRAQQHGGGKAASPDIVAGGCNPSESLREAEDDSGASQMSVRKGQRALQHADKPVVDAEDPVASQVPVEEGRRIAQGVGEAASLGNDADGFNWSEGQSEQEHLILSACRYLEEMEAAVRRGDLSELLFPLLLVYVTCAIQPLLIVLTAFVYILYKRKAFANDEEGILSLDRFRGYVTDTEKAARLGDYSVLILPGLALYIIGSIYPSWLLLFAVALACYFSSKTTLTGDAQSNEKERQSTDEAIKNGTPTKCNEERPNDTTKETAFDLDACASKKIHSTMRRTNGLQNESDEFPSAKHEEAEEEKTAQEPGSQTSNKGSNNSYLCKLNEHIKCIQVAAQQSKYFAAVFRVLVLVMVFVVRPLIIVLGVVLGVTFMVVLSVGLLVTMLWALCSALFWYGPAIIVVLQLFFVVYFIARLV